MHGVAERIEDRRDVAVDARGVAPDVRHRQRDVLGERARVVDADPVRVRAQVPPARHAVAAAAAHEVALAADEVAGREVVDVGSDCDHLADELVADDQSATGTVRCAHASQRVDVKVGAADARALQHGSERR